MRKSIKVEKVYYKLQIMIDKLPQKNARVWKLNGSLSKEWGDLCFVNDELFVMVAQLSISIVPLCLPYLRW